MGIWGVGKANPRESSQAHVIQHRKGVFTVFFLDPSINAPSYPIILLTRLLCAIDHALGRDSVMDDL